MAAVELCEHLPPLVFGPLTLGQPRVACLTKQQTAMRERASEERVLSNVVVADATTIRKLLPSTIYVV